MKSRDKKHNKLKIKKISISLSLMELMQVLQKLFFYHVQRLRIEQHLQ
ncbi:MAG: Unknown protein [uncultured Sulfurovum sp.]|uniref:Uncharacterized protein n=1 Tax=uncultured Sulfurovum sp. TaxID=269237 RepID=A0A6S6TDT0_9BACT|nr:MAG: Unknown protein [uncultured Sulfurovum sp.]